MASSSALEIYSEVKHTRIIRVTFESSGIMIFELHCNYLQSLEVVFISLTKMTS
jgi:hypothetical protein